MKVLVTGDWHTDWLTAGVRRYEDVENAAMQVVGAAHAQRVQRFIFLGDLSDPEGALWANRLAIRVSMKLPASCEAYWLVGNHDVVEDGYGTHTMVPLAATGANVIDLPVARRLAIEDRKETWLLAFPYTSTARSYNPVDKVQEFAEMVPTGSSVIVISHLMLEGIGPGSETKDMARGRDVFLPVELLQRTFPGCTIYNGHYHTAQTFNGVHLPGSLIRLTQSEIGNHPNYLIGDHS